MILPFRSSCLLLKHLFFLRKMATTTNGPTAFHGTISSDHPTYKPERNRYILYVAYACPWASRTLIARKLKKLDDFIRVIVVDPLFSADNFWQFQKDTEPDPVMNATLLRDIYMTYHPDYAGRFSVPVLFDSQTKTIVNNESAEIIRVFNTGFNDVLTKPSVDLYPTDLRQEIESLNEWIFSDINRGVYKTGMFGRFLKTQEEHETNCKALFAALDRVEGILAKRHFLAGDVVTEADVRLFTTMVRFPIVYECHFKCNLKSLRNDVDYPNIFRWTKMFYQLPGVAETVNREHIKQHYYRSMKTINPSGLVPLYNGPNWLEPKFHSTEADFAWFK